MSVEIKEIKAKYIMVLKLELWYELLIMLNKGRNKAKVFMIKILEKTIKNNMV